MKWQSLDGTIHETEDKWAYYNPGTEPRYRLQEAGMFVYWSGGQGPDQFRYLIYPGGHALDLRYKRWLKAADANGLCIEFDDWCKA